MPEGLTAHRAAECHPRIGSNFRALPLPESWIELLMAPQTWMKSVGGGAALGDN